MLQESEGTRYNLCPWFVFEVLQNSKIVAESWDKDDFNNIYNTLLWNATLKKENYYTFNNTERITQPTIINSCKDWLHKKKKELFFYHIITNTQDRETCIFPYISDKYVLEKMLKDVNIKEPVLFERSKIPFCIIKLQEDCFILCNSYSNQCQSISFEELWNYLFICPMEAEKDRLITLNSFDSSEKEHSLNYKIKIMVIFLWDKPDKIIYNTSSNLPNIIPNYNHLGEYIHII